MKWNARLWKNSVPQFTKFMSALVASLGRSERRRAATHYVEGLLMPGQRKSIEPLAERVGVDSQSLQQLLTSSPWSDEALWRAIRQEVVPHLEPLEAWVVDETGWVAAPIAGRLYLPQSWAEDPGRRAEVGVPAEVSFQTKPELTLDLVRQAQADGVPAAPLLGDAVYGDSPEFREGIRQLGMEFFLHVTPTHKAWTHPVSTQRKRTRHYLAEGVPPAQSLAEITAGFPPEQWKSCSWKAADRQRRRTRLAWCEVYLQHRLREGGENWKKLGWSWTGRSKRPNPITTTSPTFIASPHGPPASSSVAPAGTSNNTSNAPKTIWAWITLKGDRGAAFIII